MMSKMQPTDPRFLLFLLLCGVFCYFSLKMNARLGKSGRRGLVAIPMACFFGGCITAQCLTKQDIYIGIFGVSGASFGAWLALRLDRTLENRPL